MIKGIDLKVEKGDIQGSMDFDDIAKKQGRKS